MTPKQRSIFPRLLLIGLLLLALHLAFAYGILVGKNRIFPYQLITSLKQSVSPSPYGTTTHQERRAKLFDIAIGKTDIVFIGDSHTEFGSWSTPFTNKSVANRGIHEDTTADVLKRVDSILATKPDQAFIMLGVNDVFTDIAIENIVENYQELIQILQNNNVDVVIQSTVQCHISFCGTKKIESVNALNQRLAQLSADMELRFLSLDKLSDSRGLETSLTYDGIHLTPEGYRIWINILHTFATE